MELETQLNFAVLQRADILTASSNELRPGTSQQGRNGQAVRYTRPELFRLVFCFRNENFSSEHQLAQFPRTFLSLEGRSNIEWRLT